MVRLLVPIVAAFATAGAVASPTQALNLTLQSSDSDLTNGSVAMLQEGYQCKLPRGGLSAWYYEWEGWTSDCNKQHDDNGAWSMLNAYRDGGDSGRHFKYTNNPNDPQCLTDWTYYASDGRTVIAHIKGRLTNLRSKRFWCAMPRYRKKGVQGKQWEYCTCGPARR